MITSRPAFLTAPAHRIRFVYLTNHSSWLNQIETVLVRLFGCSLLTPTATSFSNRCPRMEKSFRMAMIPCVALPNGLSPSLMRELTQKCLECHDKLQGSLPSVCGTLLLLDSKSFIRIQNGTRTRYEK